VFALPKTNLDRFQCFWASGTGWGTFSLHRRKGRTQLAIKVLLGSLNCRSCEFEATGNAALIEIDGRSIVGTISQGNERCVVALGEALRLEMNDELKIEARA
jgi:hypothetical protein